MTNDATARQNHVAARPLWRDRRWLATGVGWGMAATALMTAVMLGGVATGVSPMPKPIPIALVAHTLGELPMPSLLVLGLAAHFGYGGAAGAVFAALTRRRANLLTGATYGVVLWLLMDLVWLPYLGWGVFGTAITPAIAAATLLLHLIYGTTMGGILGRFHLARSAPTAANTH